MSTTALHPTAMRTATQLRATTPQRCEPAAPASGKLRLTRRGRVLFASVVAVLGILLVAAALRPVGAVAEVPAPVIETTTITVMPGDTLWELAGSLGMEGDVRDVVEQIRTLNDLQGTSLRAGQSLLVPTPAR